MTTATAQGIKPHDPQGIAGSLLLSKPKVAEYIGISVNSLDRLRKKDGAFPLPVDVCGPTKLFWRAADIERYVAKLPPLTLAAG